MIRRTRWFDRKFPPIHENGRLPSIIERLAGTSVLLTAKTATVDSGGLEFPADGKWSVKKEIGHLIDLEPLWLARVEDFIEGRKDLAAADLTNRKTHETDHNAAQIDDLLAEFGIQRNRLLGKIRGLEDDVFERSLIHPRLGTTMRIVDLVFFVAEHDDHHLARISSILSAYEPGPEKL